MKTMSHTFHCHLSKSFYWYKNWHKHPHHQHAHWSSFIVITFFVFSFISGSINSTGQFYSERNIAKAQTINVLNFSGNTDLNISGWQQRINLQSVTFNGLQICLNSSDYGFLTGVNDGGGGLISGNFWIFAFINGQWEAGTYDYFRPTTNGCTEAASVNHYGYLGGAVRNSAFTSTKFTPQQGVTYGFMISGIARTGLGLDGTNEHFISNIVTIPWTGPTAGSGGGSVIGQFDLSQPNNNFYSKLSNYVTEARNRNIYTIVQVYNMWLDDPGEGWNLNPFNPKNNSNSQLDYITDSDVFALELTKAIANDMSQNSVGRQFLRSVWQTMIQKLAQNTPADHVLLEPLVEPFKDEGLTGFNRTTIISQSKTWWGKGSVVDNPAGRNDAITGGAIYRDYHDNSNNPGLVGSSTIIDTDVSCTPPSDGTIISMSNAARSGGGSYLVYDCDSSIAWNSRVINALQSSLSGSQPSAVMGSGTLIGYGGPDFWSNINVATFLQQLKNAGGNLTFLLAVGNPSVVTDLPWIKNISGGPPPPPPPPPGPPPPPPACAFGGGSQCSDWGSGSNISQWCGCELLCTGTNINLACLAPPPPPEPTGTESPIITSINPLIVYPGETIEITGEFLDTDVQFTDTNDQSSYAAGIISEDNRVVTVTIPDSLPIGIYNVSVISPNDITTALDLLTITEIQNPIGPSAQSIETPTTAATFNDLISSAFNYAIMLVGIAVFIMIMWAGFLWVTSAAKPGNIATAKGYISNAIFGGILLLSSYVILYTINPQLVGGEFDLKGITVPPPIQVPPPPDSGNVNPNIGCGTNQQLAQDLIDDLSISNFSASAGCGGNNHAQQNIIDMASGLCPSVCADKCTPACTAGGSTGNITVDPEILEALSTLRTGRSIRFTVTSFTTGDHSLTSYHYAGRAVDIVVTPANSGVWSEAKNFLNSIGGSAICEIAGTVIPKCDDFSSGAHIHWQK